MCPKVVQLSFLGTRLAISRPLASEAWAKCTSDYGFGFLQLLEAILVHVASEDPNGLQCCHLVSGGGLSLLYRLALFLLRLALFLLRLLYGSP